MEDQKSIKFNKVYLLHSLRNSDYNLTRQLATREFPSIQRKNSNFTWETLETNNFDQMDEALAHILHETKHNGILPLIQFDIHGFKEHFITNTHDCINFDDIYEKVSAINLASRFNLLLFILSCNGATFLSQIYPLKPSPCWGFISSSKEFIATDASNFIEAYANIFSGKTGWRFVDALNEGTSTHEAFSIYSAEEIFRRIFLHYISSYTSEEQIHKRAVSIQESRRRGYYDLDEMMRHKTMLKDTARQFELCKTTFFMTSELPENKERFPLTVHDLFTPSIIGEQTDLPQHSENPKTR